MSEAHSPLPSVDRIVRRPDMTDQCRLHGRAAVVDAIRAVLTRHRAISPADGQQLPTETLIADEVAAYLEQRSTPTLRAVFNLTGVVLHTNLGRALLSESAIQQVSGVMRQPCNLEYDLDTGHRGERDSVVERLVMELSGAEAVAVVNNNAAAVLLVLAALSNRREVILSRGELIEIGGSFRIPDVMRSAGVRLVEVGTTNRTHLHDYEAAISDRTAALMKVHTSNYHVSGFVSAVAQADLATMAHAHELPLIVDLGSGSLLALEKWGLPREPVVRDVLAAGADIVTFSGDKLLGGPQAGLIAGRKSLVDRIRRHPLRRALRVSKLTLAALEATLLAYRSPDLLARNLPTFRLLTRPMADIEAAAGRLQPRVASALGPKWIVAVVPVASQVGSGSLPVDVMPSRALAIRPAAARSGSALQRLAVALRKLPVPIIGRIAGNQLLLDLRCLEDEASFLQQMEEMS